MTTNGILVFIEYNETRGTYSGTVRDGAETRVFTDLRPPRNGFGHQVPFTSRTAYGYMARLALISA